MSAGRKKKQQAAAGQAAGPDSVLPDWLDRPWRLELALAGFLALALLIYFRDFVFDGGVMLAGHDMITQGLQTRKLGIEAARAGDGYPLWNPYSYCGIPYLGFLPGPLFFPTTLLYFIMPIERAIGWSFIIMILAGGLFTWLWITELGLARPAAALCAVSYSFTGWVASTLVGGHDGRMFVVLLAPLVFFFAERGLKRKKAVYFLLMGLAVAGQILSPQVQMMYFCSLALAAYFLFRLVGLHRDGESFGTLVRLSAGFAAGFLVAVSLAAVQFGPLLANQQYSHRQIGLGLGYEGWEHATDFSMYPLETVGLIVPGFTGEPDLYWGPEQFKSHSEYMGLLPLFFAAVALACRRNRMTIFFACLAGLALLFCWGGYTPFYKLPFYLLPKVKDFRGPNMMFFVAALSLITLMGYGLDYLLTRKSAAGGRKESKGVSPLKVIGWGLAGLAALAFVIGASRAALPNVLTGMIHYPDPRQALPLLAQHYPAMIRAAVVSLLVGGVIFGLVWLWSRGKIPLAAFVGLLAVVSYGDLMRMDRQWMGVVETRRYYNRDNIVQYLQQQQFPCRVFFYPSQIIPEGMRDFWDNSLLYFQIPTVNASMPLRIKWFETLYGTHLMRNLARDPRQWNVVASQGGQRPPVDIPHPRYWNLLAANYVMFRKSQLTPFFEKEYPFLRKVAEDDLTRRVLYENPEAWPRLMFFTRAEVLADDRQFLDRLNDPAFDPRQTLVLAEQPDFDISALDGGPPGTARAEITAYRWGRMTVSAECDRPALLYLAEAYHPDWRATVDGRPARIYRAELALRAVYLEPGRHEIELRYESAPYRWGKWITLVALAVSLVWVGWTAYRKDW